MVAEADFLAPEGYEVALPNAVTRHGEHGNALVALAAGRNRPPRCQRSPLRAARPAARAGALERARRLSVVVHFGLAHRSRVRRVQRLADPWPRRCRRTNCWSSPATSTTGAGSTRRCASSACTGPATCWTAPRSTDLPSRVPVFMMDRIYTRGLACRSTAVPRGTAWAHVGPSAAAGRAGSGLGWSGPASSATTACSCCRAATNCFRPCSAPWPPRGSRSGSPPTSSTTMRQAGRWSTP